MTVTKICLKSVRACQTAVCYFRTARSIWDRKRSSWVASASVDGDGLLMWIVISTELFFVSCFTVQARLNLWTWLISTWTLIRFQTEWYAPTVLVFVFWYLIRNNIFYWKIRKPPNFWNYQNRPEGIFKFVNEQEVIAIATTNPFESMLRR